MITTIEEAKATAARHAPESTTLELAAVCIELQPGEHYAGAVLADDGRPLHHLILLPGQADEVTWDAAKAWAADAGGELPTRREQSLLFANLKDQFESSWYWSSEAYERDGSYAWGQYFTNGSQYSTRKSFEGRARAVRLIPLTA